jgi:hypothetical protein
VAVCGRIFRAGLVLGVIAGSSNIGAQAARGDWQQADEATVRLSPGSFPALPSEVRGELERRGCKIPQPANAGQLQNVISGKFTGTTVLDWAVLCSREKQSAILVFHRGRSKSMDELANEPDAHYLQMTEHGRIGFSRLIMVAPGDAIRRHLGRHAALKPTAIDHDGIENSFVGKASTVWYWSGGKWIQLSQTD